MPSSPGEATNCRQLGWDHKVQMWKIRKGQKRDHRGRFLSGKIIGILFDKGTRFAIRCRVCGEQEQLPVTWLGSHAPRSNDFPWR